MKLTILFGKCAFARSKTDWLPIVVCPGGTASNGNTGSTTTTTDRLLLAQHLLRPFNSHTANVHLVVLVLDAVVGNLAPELISGEGFAGNVD